MTSRAVRSRSAVGRGLPIALIAMAALTPRLASAEGAVLRTAIIVGVNEPFDTSQPTLRYADDDAARFFELLAPAVDHVELLTVLDAESQALHADAAAHARPPSHAELVRALAAADALARRARSEGRRAELVFVYTGHGRVRGGEGEVKLLDAVLARSELTGRVLASDAHDRTHVVVDACNAYLLVSARGPDGVESASIDAAFERFVDGQSIDRFPRVGLVLSTSGPGASHEWSRLRGGVFSHEVRSALAGAADVGGDGRVDYVELEAFLAAANLNVPEPKGRPRVFVRAPPIDRGAALVAWRDAALPALELPAALGGHYWLEDDRGVRYAEIHKAEGHAMALRLVRRPSYSLWSGDGLEVARFDAPAGRVAVALPLIAGRSGATERSGDAAGPDGLFTEPFGPRFIDGFRARLELLGAAPLGPAEPTGPSLGLFSAVAGGIAALALGGAIWQGVVAEDRYDDYAGTLVRTERDALAADVEASRGRALGLGVTAGVAAVVAAVLFVVDD